MEPKDIENPIAEEDFRHQIRVEIDINKCKHEFISKEYISQTYGTCLVCGQTIWNINIINK